MMTAIPNIKDEASNTQTTLFGIDGSVIATVERLEDAQLFAAASALRDAVETLRAELIRHLDAEKSDKNPAIQKADLVLRMAPKHNPGHP